MADKWRRIADRLAGQLASHAYNCPGHPGSADECPFCVDTAVYEEYVAAGGIDHLARRDPGGTPVTLPELLRQTPEPGE